MGREVAVWAGTMVWLAVVVCGFWLWERYDTTPGAAGAAPVAAAEPCGDHWRLTVFAHPRCPCTRATLGELAELTRTSPELGVRVVFVRPAGARGDWERGDSWDAANAIPGAAVLSEAGETARRFGAETSGFVVLTDPNGRAVFRGGLTRARGRAGESAGRRAILAWLDTGNGPTTAPVFGCPLFTPED